MLELGCVLYIVEVYLIRPYELRILQHVKEARLTRDDKRVSYFSIGLSSELCYCDTPKFAAN